MRAKSIAGACATALACAAILLVACGGDPPAPPPRSLPGVQLTIAAPLDRSTVDGETVEIRGRVSPATATVSVLGRPARVGDGTFSAEIPLEPGANVVDVIASASRRSPRFAAIRVTRLDRVTVPELVGTPAADLEDALDPLGLDADVEQGGSIIDPLIPLRRKVCEQDPAEGTRVRRGTTVHVVVARSC